MSSKTIIEQSVITGTAGSQDMDPLHEMDFGVGIVVAADALGIHVKDDAGATGSSPFAQSFIARGHLYGAPFGKPAGTADLDVGVWLT